MQKIKDKLKRYLENLKDIQNDVLFTTENIFQTIRASGTDELNELEVIELYTVLKQLYQSKLLLCVGQKDGLNLYKMTNYKAIMEWLGNV